MMRTCTSAKLAVALLLWVPATGHATEQVYYFHNDHLGTPQAMTNAAGVKVWEADYEPFGKAMVNQDPDGDGQIVINNLRFPGQYYDAETGLHYNYHRDYDPETGRYLQPDPAGPVARFVAMTQGARASICDSMGGQGFLEDESDGALGEMSQTLEFGADATSGGSLDQLGAELMLDAADLNTYGYALQNPLTYVDPTGENPAAGRAAQAAAIALRMARAGAVAAWGFCKSIQCKVKIHPDHHYFGPPFNRKMRHVQATCWRKGIKGSTINIRIPIP